MVNCCSSWNVDWSCGVTGSVRKLHSKENTEKSSNTATQILAQKNKPICTVNTFLIAAIVPPCHTGRGGGGGNVHNFNER